MSENTNLLKLLREYGEKTGMGEIGFAADGICTLSYDDRVVLQIAPGATDDDAMLYSVVGAAVAEDERAAVYESALIANLYPQNIGGGTLAIDETDRSIILIRRLSVANLPYPDFQLAIEQVVDAAEVWQQRLDRSVVTDSGAAQSDEVEQSAAGLRV